MNILTTRYKNENELKKSKFSQNDTIQKYHQPSKNYKPFVIDVLTIKDLSTQSIEKKKMLYLNFFFFF